jgi:hypothetical protein
MPTVSMLFSRRAIVPVWPLVFGLFVLLGSPMAFATRVVLLLAAGLALTIMLGLWKEPLPTVVAMTTPGPARAPSSSSDFVPNSWPNSGYRNSGQRRTKGV